jgi:hypothetical protein
MSCTTCNKIRGAINTALGAVGVKTQLPMLPRAKPVGVNPIWQKITKGKK